MKYLRAGVNVALLLLAVSLTTSNAQDLSKCNMDLIKRMLNCCSVPRLTSQDAAKGCPSANSTVGSKFRNFLGKLQNAGKTFGSSVVQAGKQITSLSSVKKVPSILGGGLRNAFSKISAKQFGSLSPFCPDACIFKNQNLLTSEGKVDVGLASAAFVNEVPERWRLTIQNATSNCSNMLTQMYKKFDEISSTMSTKAPMPNEACKPCATFFTTCVRVNSILSCPAFFSSTSCAADLETLKSCASNIPSIIGLPPMQMTPMTTSMPSTTTSA